MRLSRFAVNRPVFTVMAVLIVIILGTISLFRLPIDLMPDITYPTLSITTRYTNASPEEVEQLITRPIEEAMSAVPGAESVSSVSGEGISNVRVNFTWGTELSTAASDVRERLDRVIARLPADADRPTLSKFDLASFPILILGASSHMDPGQTRRVIDTQVKYRLERLPGVASISTIGGRDREIHINLSADRIKALGLSIDQLLRKIKAENVNVPAGPSRRGNLEIMIRTPGQYSSLKELADTVIAERAGAPVRLRDVAQVEDAWQKVIRIVRVNNKPGIRMSVNKQSGTNTVEVARGVLKEIDRINRDIPQIQITPIIDTSDYIQRSITNVGTSILYGGTLAIFVLLFFLRNIGSTAVIATAIPISVIATFSLMYFGHFTLNLMTLGGLALGIGMLVDNAIVVLENIYRMREAGLDPKEAAIKGSEEVTPAILASTLTTLAVFLPLVFVRGMSGIMFQKLAYVVSFALACSLVAALTLVPMLASRMLPAGQFQKRGNSQGNRSLFSISARIFKRLEQEYILLLRFALRRPILIIAGSLLILAGSLMLIPYIGVEFMPSTDEGEVRVYAEMEVGTRLELVDAVFRHIEQVVKKEVPEIKNTTTYIGGSSWRPRGSHMGQMRIALKPKTERSRSSEEIAVALMGKLKNVPGARIRTRASRGLFLLRMGSSGGDRVEVEIRGYDLKVADLLARRVKETLEEVEGVTDARMSRDPGNPEELIIVDRQKAADMKVTTSQIAGILQTVLTGSRASYFREGGNEYAIMVKIKDAESMPLREVLDLTLTNAEGAPVVLRNLVRVRPRKGPVMIERQDQQRVVTVSANTAGRDMGSILGDIREALRTIPVPSDFSIVLSGDYEEQQKAFRELLLSFVLALVLVYMVMASLYESLRDPFVVMFSVPLAAIGVVLMLLLTSTTFNVQTYIGCIMLGGIVVNNAILLVDHTNQLYKREGMPLREAIEEAGRRRFRPILMTAITTILALVPLAIGIGEGGEAQAPMAKAVIGGLMSSTLITLVFIPTVYSLFKRRNFA